MNREQIIRAWKDEEYRSGLSGAELDVMPQHPAGVILLTDDEMGRAVGKEEAGISIAISIAISYEVVTFTISFHSCHPTIAGGTCAYLSAGCCKDVDHLAG